MPPPDGGDLASVSPLVLHTTMSIELYSVRLDNFFGTPRLASRAPGAVEWYFLGGSASTALSFTLPFLVLKVYGVKKCGGNSHECPHQTHEILTQRCEKIVGGQLRLQYIRVHDTEQKYACRKIHILRRKRSGELLLPQFMNP